MRIGMVCPYSFDKPGGVQSHVLDKMLFPDAPVTDPPALLDQVAKI